MVDWWCVAVLDEEGLEYSSVFLRNERPHTYHTSERYRERERERRRRGRGRMRGREGERGRERGREREGERERERERVSECVIYSILQKSNIYCAMIGTPNSAPSPPVTRKRTNHPLTHTHTHTHSHPHTVTQSFSDHFTIIIIVSDL